MLLYIIKIIKNNTIKKKSLISVILLITLFTISSCSKNKSHKNKIPDVIHTSHLPSGWYTQEKQQLSQEIDLYLASAKKAFDVTVDPATIKALIVPHAGHYYSGLCAASAYQTLQNQNAIPDRKNQSINRVIILAPSHTHFFNGVSLPYYTKYQTVLGDLQVETQAITLLSKNQLFKQFEDAHMQEHAIEVQLPFLQKTIANFTIIPLIVGHIKDITEYYQIAEQIKKVMTDQTLIVVSSDFLHYGKNYDFVPFGRNIIDNIRFLDSLVIQAITAQSLNLFNNVLLETNATVCGREPIKILLALLEAQVFNNHKKRTTNNSNKNQENHGENLANNNNRDNNNRDNNIIETRLACYYTSAHVPGARKNNLFDSNALFATIPDGAVSNSVSYAGLIFTSQQLSELKKEARLTGYEKKALLKLARTSVKNEFQDQTTRTPEHLLAPIVSPGIEQKTGAFVTLTSKNHNLRGCIGRIISNDPLYTTVRAMSKAAAFNDSRFSPVTPQELENLRFDISVLSQPERISSVVDIQLGKHGIILTKLGLNNHPLGAAVFLPQVPVENRWNLETTLEHLSEKAGFDKTAWQHDCAFEVFEGFEIKE